MLPAVASTDRQPPDYDTTSTLGHQHSQTVGEDSMHGGKSKTSCRVGPEDKVENWFNCWRYNVSFFMFIARQGRSGDSK